MNPPCSADMPRFRMCPKCCSRNAPSRPEMIVHEVAWVSCESHERREGVLGWYHHRWRLNDRRQSTLQMDGSLSFPLEGRKDRETHVIVE